METLHGKIHPQVGCPDQPQTSGRGNRSMTLFIFIWGTHQTHDGGYSPILLFPHGPAERRREFLTSRDKNWFPLSLLAPLTLPAALEALQGASRAGPALPAAPTCVGALQQRGLGRACGEAGGGHGQGFVQSRLPVLLEAFCSHQGVGELLQGHVVDVWGEGAQWVLQAHQPAGVACTQWGMWSVLPALPGVTAPLGKAQSVLEFADKKSKRSKFWVLLQNDLINLLLPVLCTSPQASQNPSLVTLLQQIPKASKTLRCPN